MVVSEMEEEPPEVKLGMGIEDEGEGGGRREGEAGMGLWGE